MLALQERLNLADVALDRAGINAELEAELIAKARRSAIVAIKRRARVYLVHPERLDALVPGLWCASPECLIKTGRTMLENELRFPRRHFGFGGEVQAINAKALILYGRYGRRWWARLAMLAKGAA